MEGILGGFEEMTTLGTRYHSWLTSRRRVPRSTASIKIAADGPTMTPGHEIYLFADARWFRDDKLRVEQFASLFVSLCHETSAFLGTASHMVRGRVRRPDLGREIWDVEWLNYFGPSYREYWGSRLAGLGVRQEDTASGGVVIWATDSPFEISNEAKTPFYEALGRDTFAVTKTREAEPGELVPDYEAHKRHAPGGERWIRGFPRPCNQYQAATAFRLIDGMPICKNCGYTEPEHEAPRSGFAR
jgi:hypothetical protein